MEVLSELRNVLVREVFTDDERKNPRLKGSQFILLGFAVLVGLIVGLVFWRTGVRLISVAGPLTATSILTGMTFTMAMKFWERRVDPVLSLEDGAFAEKSQIIKSMSSVLIWVSLVGILSTGWNAVCAYFATNETPIYPWAVGISSGILTYQLSLVVGALVNFHKTAIALAS